MTMMNLTFEAFLSNEKTARLFGVYHKALEVVKARETLLEARETLYAHCKEAHGLEPEQTWELYWYWRGRRLQR